MSITLFALKFLRLLKNIYTYQCTFFTCNTALSWYSIAQSISTNPPIKTGKIIFFCHTFFYLTYFGHIKGNKSINVALLYNRLKVTAYTDFCFVTKMDDLNTIIFCYTTCILLPPDLCSKRIMFCWDQRSWKVCYA